ncbi:MAG: CagC family type IV secretion system protein, partial [Lacticaseibacillus paracasei]
MSLFYLTNLLHLNCKSVIKRMPDADDPREKSEVYHAVGRVAGLVALAAAIIWILPWVYSLFT